MSAAIFCIKTFMKVHQLIILGCKLEANAIYDAGPTRCWVWREARVGPFRGRVESDHVWRLDRGFTVAWELWSEVRASGGGGGGV